MKKGQIPNMRHHIISAASSSIKRTPLRMVFGFACMAATSVLLGFDPTHFVLGHGTASAFMEGTAFFLRHGVMLGLTSTLGGFLLTELALSARQTIKHGHSLGYFVKKSLSSTFGVASGAVAFLTGGILGAESAQHFSGASLFEKKSFFGTSENPYNYSRISDEFDHFDVSEMGPQDVLDGTAETLTQMQDIVLSGFGEAAKQTTTTGFFTSPDFVAGAMVLGGALVSCYAVYWSVCKLCNMAFKTQSTHEAVLARNEAVVAQPNPNIVQSSNRRPS